MNNILIPVFAHIVWCALLYAFLTVARAPAVWGVGADTNGQNPFEHIKQSISANLSNQFEWPMFFHMLCIVLYTSSLEVSNAMLGLAWVFIAKPSIA
ncbi:MAPEG family protein [Alteromonas gracilis]|uniref:MAPEG family protein n=1 Tax=Alteromonas gracilis TaxID=1479524 RepID=UPI0030D2A1DA